MRRLFIFLFVEKEVGTERIGGETSLLSVHCAFGVATDLVTAGMAAGVRDLVQQMLHATNYALHAVLRFRGDGPGGARRMVLLGSSVVLRLPASRHILGLTRFVRDAAHRGAVLLIEVNRCRVKQRLPSQHVTQHVITHAG
jgi:hypothetical protein